MRPSTLLSRTLRTTPHLRLALAVCSLFLLATAVAAPLSAQSCPTVVWADEFDGTSLDLSKWEPQIGDGCDIGLCGWGNNELQYYKAENATVSNGTLKITAKEERVKNKQYTSARLRTLNQGDFYFGRMEARIKLTEGQGIWPAFWMLPTDEVYGGWPQSGEIDIMENVGHEPARVHGTIHYGQPYPDNSSTGAHYDLPSGKFSDGFHTFAIEKEQGVIRWYVDDVLYSTKTPSDTDPEIWPFDERFHFLLNVAVGGNWPGNPDETTVFPQVLEADYVRVYDGNKPHIAGDRVVSYQESGVTYTVGNAVGTASYNWTVPAGATIVSGAGTSQITVDWGDTGGTVTADVSDDCGSHQLAIGVFVEPNYVKDFSFENWDDAPNMTPSLFTGTLVEIANPDSSGINPSALSGEYMRNSAETYDVMVWTTSAIPDAGAYADGTRRFVVDVMTAAPVGTTVLLQLEDSSQATSSNYPTGRHSRYQAQTGVQNEWERLELPFLDRPDGSVPDSSVDTLILLLAPNTQTGDVYVLDNIDGYVVEGGSGDPGGGDPTAVHVESIVTGTQSAGQGQKHATADVTIVDDLGGAVAGATVTGTFTGDYDETVTGTTGTDGLATLVTTSTAKGNVSFTFCVDDVQASLPYDSSANQQTCG